MPSCFVSAKDNNLPITLPSNFHVTKRIEFSTWIKKTKLEATHIVELYPNTGQDAPKFKEFTDYLLTRDRGGVVEEGPPSYTILIIPACSTVWKFMRTERNYCQLFAFITLTNGVISKNY